MRRAPGRLCRKEFPPLQTRSTIPIDQAVKELVGWPFEPTAGLDGCPWKSAQINTNHGPGLNLFRLLSSWQSVVFFALSQFVMTYVRLKLQQEIFVLGVILGSLDV